MTARLQYRWHKGQKFLKHYFMLGYHRLFNRVVRRQLRDFKRIPIIIISFNQLYYLRQLIDRLKFYGYNNIVIIDNNSSYPPLLSYLEHIEKEVTVYRLDENLGHLAFWKTLSLVKKYGKGYYAVTDPDVVPLDDCPVNFLLNFRRLLDQSFDRTKVGFSLDLRDLPDNNPNKERILTWESKFYTTSIHPMAYKAEIDTTFALYKPGYRYQLKDFTKAWRTKHPLQAKHGGWYIDPNNLTEEQQYYMKTANSSASWRVNEDGKLVDKVHKPLYDA